jgi:hypothetical protein
MPVASRTEADVNLGRLGERAIEGAVRSGERTADETLSGD